MSELNEKLAELCGLVVREDGFWELEGIYPEYTRPESDAWEFHDIDNWNPTDDLNQLKMCYEAAEKDDVFFVERFLDALIVLIRPLCACNIVSSHELTHAIFKHPELVAQAILKAKGVS